MTAATTLVTALQRIRPDVRAMAAYHVQPAAGLLKMDAMENPFPLPPALQAALGQRLGALEINRYPGERIGLLQQALAQYVDVPAGCQLMLGNGSDELISLVGLACARPGAQVLAPLPGFVMYGMSAQLQGLGFTGVALTPDFELDAVAMEAAIAYAQDRVIGGQALTERQGIRWMIADMGVAYRSALLLSQDAARQRQAAHEGTGGRFSLAAAMAKLAASEAAGRIADTALQLHGGYGYTRDFPVERINRDLRIMRIYEGSSEIQRNIISGNMLA